jgi:uncharacterized tellurite resistance protein B-like protein
MYKLKQMNCRSLFNWSLYQTSRIVQLSLQQLTRGKRKSFEPIVQYSRRLTMRNYRPNSPEATARVIALALLADGAIDLSELKALEQHDIVGRLGLDHAGFDRVVHEFCEDMLTYAHRMPSSHLELETEIVNELLDEIRDPLLQRKVLRAMLDIVNADGRLAGGEAVLVSQAMKLWGIDLYEVSHAPTIRSRRLPPQVKVFRTAA